MISLQDQLVEQTVQLTRQEVKRETGRGQSFKVHLKVIPLMTQGR
jgi:hypothetical protein